MDVLYTAGADLLALIETEDFRWLVARAAYVPDPDHEFVADVTNEITSVGYARDAISSPARTPMLSPDNFIAYDADDPNFGGAVAAGQTGAWLILFLFVTNDADSRLVGALEILKPTNGGPYVVVLDPAGFAATAQA